MANDSKGLIMIYALLKALILKPQLLTAHVRNYGEFVRSEMQGTVRQWAITAAAWATFAIGMLVFVLLCGVAAMIGMLHGQYHWILIVVPAIPLLLAVAALIVALRKTEGSSIDTIKQQFAADMQALNGPTVKDHEH